MAQNEHIRGELGAYEAKLEGAHRLMQDLTHAQVESVNHTAVGLGHIKSAIEALRKAHEHDSDALRLARGIMALLMEADVITRPLGLEASKNADAVAILQGPESIARDVQEISRNSSRHSNLITTNTLGKLQASYDLIESSNAEVSLAASKGTDVLGVIENAQAASEAYREGL